MPISAQLLNELFTCIQLVGRAYHRNDAASAIHHGQGKLLHILLTHDGCSQRELAGDDAYPPGFFDRAHPKG